MNKGAHNQKKSKAERKKSMKKVKKTFSKYCLTLMSDLRENVGITTDLSTVSLSASSIALKLKKNSLK